MLEGHVLRELLTPDLKATQFFAFHEVFHGVTAPRFLFGAGGMESLTLSKQLLCSSDLHF
jgi:hypothetical protein